MRLICDWSPMIRKSIAASAILVAVALGAGACSSSSADDSNSAFCKELRSLSERGESIFPRDASDSEGFQQALDEAKKLEKQAPKAIKEDVEVIVQAIERVKDGNLEALSDPEFGNKLQVAAQNISEYGTKVCKVEPPSSQPE